ncbi:hypothetical protein [Burkholderia phage BCSR5]|nr:hypothetical protein [Burkholderia phage BCSR5]
MLAHNPKFIYVTFQRKGYHFYPNAPEDVAYLRDRHRHLFKFRIQIEVHHDNREIEFHQFLNMVEGWYEDGTLELNHKSCEMIADDLAKRLDQHYQGDRVKRDLIIEVSEDGECGAVCHYIIQ